MRIVIIQMQRANRAQNDCRAMPIALPIRAKPSARRITSSDLFNGAREIVIDHDGRLYQLRITQNGKLILTA